MENKPVTTQDSNLQRKTAETHGARRFRPWLVISVVAALAVIAVLLVVFKFNAKVDSSTAAQSGPPALQSAVSSQTNSAQPGQNPAPASTNLDLIKQSKGVTARLFAMMTFDSFRQSLPFAAELTLPPVPLTWEGATFASKVIDVGQAKDITYAAHGQISAVGEWLTTLDYMMSTASPGGLYYRLVFQNVPLSSDGLPDGSVGFVGTGADLQKYVTNIAYLQTSTSYRSTDWENQNPTQMPVLRIEFFPGTAPPVGNQGSTH